MSRRSEPARAAVACGVLLCTVELLSIAAATRWPTVDDAAAPWHGAKADVASAGSPQRADEDDVDETHASLLLGQQVLARFDDALDAARFDLASWARARSPYERFCPVAHRCD